MYFRIKIPNVGFNIKIRNLLLKELNKNLF